MAVRTFLHPSFLDRQLNYSIVVFAGCFQVADTFSRYTNGAAKPHGSL